ncbi:MAG: hypothetical protein ABI992_11995, partial [Chthoniobacterales bacterium]
WARAAVDRIVEDRNRVSANVSVPAGERPALLTFSRPYFRGYRATLNGRTLPVKSWRGFVPAVEIPAGANGRLILVYRPWWLLVGGAIALVSAVVCLAGLAAYRNDRLRFRPSTP